MKLKINDKPKLTKIKFSCDDPIHKKLDDYELTKDFLNQFQYNSFNWNYKDQEKLH